MKNRILICVLILLSLLFVSCTYEPQVHEHLYGDYSFDEMYHWKKCLCGHIDKSEHNFEYVCIKATCEEEGLESTICIECGYVLKHHTIPALGHELKNLEKLEPTCTKPGHNEGTYCLYCDYSIGLDEIPALGHSYESELTLPTCLSKGYISHTCHCGDTYIDSYVDELGHDIIVDEGTDATCTETGLTEGEHCSRCDYKVDQEVIPAKGHKESAVVVENNVLPTCVTKGSYDNVIYCSECNEELERVTIIVDELGHDIIIDERVEATCTTTGLTEGGHCSRCDHKVAQEVIPAKGHTYSDEICINCDYHYYTEGLIFTLADNEYQVSRYNGTSVSVTIPAKYNGLPVTSIGIAAFASIHTCFTVKVPNTVETISKQAFFDSYLMGIYFSENSSLLTIGSGAFFGCLLLSDITIPESVITIEDDAFANLTGSLEEIIIPNNVVSIGDRAFSGSTSLTSIIIGNNVKTIGDMAFVGTNLTEITIPNSVETIGDFAFCNCYNLVSVNISTSVTSIGSNAFEDCDGLISIIIPDSVIYMGEAVFYWCDNLTIYCEVSSQPSSWNENWNIEGIPVYWGISCNKEIFLNIEEVTETFDKLYKLNESSAGIFTLDFNGVYQKRVSFDTIMDLSEYTLTSSSYDYIDVMENGDYILRGMPYTVIVDTTAKTFEFKICAYYNLINPGFSADLSEVTILADYHNTVANIINIHLSSETDNLTVRDLNIVIEFNGIAQSLESLVSESVLNEVVFDAPCIVGFQLSTDYLPNLNGNVKILIGGENNGIVSGMIELFTA